MAEDRHGPARQAVSSVGRSAEDGIARQLSELAREMQADLTVEALTSPTAEKTTPSATRTSRSSANGQRHHQLAGQAA